MSDLKKPSNVVSRKFESADDGAIFLGQNDPEDEGFASIYFALRDNESMKFSFADGDLDEFHVKILNFRHLAKRCFVE